MRNKRKIKPKKIDDDDYIVEPIKKDSRRKRKVQKIEEFVVECILDHRIDTKNNQIEFLVKWQDYGEDEASWENFYFFSQDQPDMVEKYLLEYFDTRGDIVSNSIKFLNLTTIQELNKFLTSRKRIKDENSSNSNNQIISKID